MREIRKDHCNAVIGLMLNMLQVTIFVTAFYFMFIILGLKSAAISGDFLLYIMSGIFLFLTHTKAMSAVMETEGPTSAMMNHAPMNTIVALCAGAFSSLYTQLLSIIMMLSVYHMIFGPITIYDPAGAMAILLLAWFSGVGVGIIFFAIKPWYPNFIAIAPSIYGRANMIASGKMFVTNLMPGYILAMIDWNPLFHAIDPNRGFMFINYNPHFSSISYPVKVSLILVMIGLMLEFYTRRNDSTSRGAGH